MKNFFVRIFFIVVTACHTSYSIGDSVGGAGSMCKKWTKSHLHVSNIYSFMNSYLAFVYFESLAQLNISCASFLIDHDINVLGMKSTNKNFLLDLRFDIRPLIASLMFEKDVLNIAMHNLKGFTLNPTRHSIEHKIDTFVFIDSRFDFYLNDTQLITKELCVRQNFAQIIFNFGEELTFTNAYYSKNVCPYVFTKSPFVSITFNHIANSFIYKNQLEFLPVHEKEDLDVSNIQTLSLDVAYEHITSRLINKNVFKNVVSIELCG